jgi:hypothetical protein
MAIIFRVRAKGLIQMEDAKKIATDFISKEKSFNSIHVNSVEPKGDRWIVKGSIFTKTKHGGGSERWTVEIEGETVLSFKFEPGRGLGNYLIPFSNSLHIPFAYFYPLPRLRRSSIVSEWCFVSSRIVFSLFQIVLEVCASE